MSDHAATTTVAAAAVVATTLAHWYAEHSAVRSNANELTSKAHNLASDKFNKIDINYIEENAFERRRRRRVPTYRNNKFHNFHLCVCVYM